MSSEFQDSVSAGPVKFLTDPVDILDGTFDDGTGWFMGGDGTGEQWKRRRLPRKYKLGSKEEEVTKKPRKGWDKIVESGKWREG